MTCDHLIKIAEELIASGRLVFRYTLQKLSFNYFQNPVICVDLFDITLGELTFFKNELFKDAQNSSRSKRHRGELSEAMLQQIDRHPSCSTKLKFCI